MRNRVVWAGFGVLATVVGMAAGHLVASLLDPASSPVLAVGSTVIDLTPTPLKEWAIRQFGSNDKAVLTGSVLLGTLVLAAVAGLLARRRLVLGAGLLLVLVAAAAAAALTQPEAGLVDVVPALATAVAGVGALAWLARAATPRPRGEQGGEDLVGGGVESGDPVGRGGTGSPTRRGVLIATGALAVGAVAMGAAGRWITAARTAISDVVLPAAADPAKPFPTGLEQKVDGISPFRTPIGEFYRVDTRLSLPVVDVDSWTLTIDGDVDSELTLSFDDLAAMPLIERDITLTCVSNDVGGPYVGGARWLGVRLTDLLDRAGVGDRADQIYCTDVDGMTISVPLKLAADGRDAMLAIGMNGGPLPREHGFPVRMVVPGLYGFISACKWISRMTLTTYDDATAYWTDREWATDAPIKPASRIDTPQSFQEIDAGDTFIGGVAWAQHRGIAKVEVRVDGNAWQEARLGPSAGDDYWRQWYLPWRAEPGEHTLSVRATTQDGETQTEARAMPFPDGASGLQKIIVRVS